MAKLRKFVCYREHDRPYTRKSKYRKKDYVRASPNCKIVKFVLGNKTGSFNTRFDLVSKDKIQIRDNALEAARQTAVRFLEKKLGKSGFRLTIRVYPHQVLREHALAAGAGADRFSSGMAHSFGKPVGIAARVKKEQQIATLLVNSDQTDTARKALIRAKNKLPCQCRITKRTIPG
ncbi:50S ribosomal protein L16 [Candidatus Woesearchaeota archaeon]|nr:50S ribosomal protein L16 [Candidatus Woesearchaeota archaeon]